MNLFYHIEDGKVAGLRGTSSVIGETGFDFIPFAVVRNGILRIRVSSPFWRQKRLELVLNPGPSESILAKVDVPTADYPAALIKARETASNLFAEARDFDA